jgi:hypothetical protein
MFGLSLALSSYILTRYPQLLVSTIQRRISSYNQSDKLYNTFLRGASRVCFFLGLVCFGLAVSMNIFQ